MSNQYEIIEINSAHDFFTSGYFHFFDLTEQDYKFIEWYSEEPKALTGHHNERLKTLASLYATFLIRYKRGQYLLMEKNNIIYWIKPTEEASKRCLMT